MGEDVTIINLGAKSGNQKPSSSGDSGPLNRNRVSFGLPNLSAIDSGRDSDRGKSVRRAGRGRGDAGGTNDRNTDRDTDTETEKEVHVPVKRKRKSEIDSETINVLLLLTFGILASWRGDHWTKTKSQTSPVAVAISEYISTLPKQVSGSIKKFTEPVGLLLVLFYLLSEPLAKEKELYETRRNARAIRQQIESGTGANSGTTETFTGSPDNSFGSSRSTGFPDINFNA